MSYGRRKIYSDAKEITAANVMDEVNRAYAVHCQNQSEIEVLWKQYRGQAKILQKTKEIREEINHKINENRAYEIAKFHKGYVFGEPIQYVRRENTHAADADDIIAADINALNGYMADANKAACDNALAEWMYVAGTGYRLTLANPRWTQDGDESPFVIYSLDPRKAFIVYSIDVDEHPLMAVCCAEREDNEKVFTVYTDKFVFTYGDFTPMEIRTNTLGMNPIIEYPAENARLGVFEVAMPLLDALDELQSNRMDDIVQFVNSFLGIFGGELDEETYQKLNEWKTLCLPEGTDAKYLSATLSQSDVQTLKDDIYKVGDRKSQCHRVHCESGSSYHRYMVSNVPPSFGYGKSDQRQFAKSEVVCRVEYKRRPQSQLCLRQERHDYQPYQNLRSRKRAEQ